MKADRQIQETVARCVSTLVFYYKSPQSREMAREMAIEVRTIADRVGQLGLGNQEVEEFITRPLEAELVGRYGDALGHRLFGDFLGSFVISPPAPVPHDGRQRRYLPDGSIHLLDWQASGDYAMSGLSL